jgi:hypothetical protein
MLWVELNFCNIKKIYTSDVSVFTKKKVEIHVIDLTEFNKLN